MTSNNVDLNPHDTFLSTLNIVKQAVGATLGPSGLFVSLPKVPVPLPTKDGVSVLDSLQFENHTAQVAYSAVRSAANQTVKEAGDATTSTTILTCSLYEEMRKCTTPPKVLSDQVEAAAKVILSKLKEMALPCDDNMLEKIALISADGDTSIASTAAKAVRHAGADGRVLVQTDISDSLKHPDGPVFDANVVNPSFIPDPKTKTRIMHQPVVYASKRPMTTDKDLWEFQAWYEKHTNRQCIVLAPQFDATALRGFEKHLNRIIPYIIPNESLRNGLRDMADKNEIVSACCSYKTIEVQLADTHVAYDTLCQYLRDLDTSESKGDLAKLLGKMSYISVGGTTVEQQNERKDRMDDAVLAAQAATGGVLIGGGAALLLAIEGVTDPFDEGTAALCKALRAPHKFLCMNAGVDCLDPKKMSKTSTVDVKTGEMIDGLEAGIFDPLKVVECSVRNAVAAATTLAKTSVVLKQQL